MLRWQSHVSFKLSYSKCGLCLKDLEVIRPASGIPYIRCVDWKLCPFFCHADSIHTFQECLFHRVIPQYKVHEGGQLPHCRHMDVATLKVSRSSLTGLTVLPHWFSDKSLFFLYISAISPGWLRGTFTPLEHTHLS